MHELEGQVAIITGAARGQGEAEARLFHKQGARVVVSDVLDDLGEAIASSLGERAIFHHLDVTIEADWTSAIAAAESAFGPVTTLVNNAAVLRGGSVETTTRQTFNELFDVDVWGVFLGMQSVIPSMRKAGGGSIINISSTGGLIGQVGAVAYSGAKFAVRGISKAAALELAPDIRVNSVHPGWVDTLMVHSPSVSDEEYTARLSPVVPMRRAAQPSEIASVVAFLASDAASYMTGSEVVVDGGRTAGTPPSTS